MELKLEAPNEKQKEFLKAKTRFVGYGGARGGGKSWAVRMKATLLSLNYAGIKILLLRRTYPELKENHVVPLQKMLRNIAAYKETDKVFQFPNGSRIKLGYLDNDNDVLQYQGQEYDVIFIDEGTHFTEFMFNILTACVRGANNFPKRIYITCNPGGVGHAWVKRLFIDKEYRNDENPNDYTFIAARVYDNKALLEHDEGYVKMLENLPENLRRAWLNGEWDVFDGQYFPEFNREIHTCEPFEIPSHWVRYTSMDYGLDMLASYEYAIDEYENIYVINEIYESGLIVSDAVKKIKEVHSKDVLTRFAPPDLWNTQSSIGKSTAILFAEEGVALNKAVNDRTAGWLALKELLKVREYKTVDGETHKEPRLKIFRNCTNLIRTLPQLQYSDKKPNDVATEPHEITHAPDALRYFAVSYTTPSQPVPKSKGKMDWFFYGDEKEGEDLWE